MTVPSIGTSGGPTAVGATGVSPRTWTFSTGTPGANAKLFVAIATGDDSDTVTAVTYNGVSMSPITSVNGATTQYYTVWELANPASGSNTLSVSYAGDGTYGGVIWWCIVEDCGTVGTPFTNTGTSTAPAVSSQTCPTNGILLAFAKHAFSGSDPTISAGTAIILTRLGSNPYMIAYRTTTGGFTWATASSQLWGVIGVPIDEIAGGADYTFSVSGGVAFAGTEPIKKGRMFISAGGIIFGGTAPIVSTAEYTFNVSGGINFSGAAPLIRENIIVPSGGVTFGGTARLFFTPVGGTGNYPSRIDVGVSRVIGVS